LFIGLVEEDIVLLVDDSVAVGTVSGEHLKASSDTTRIESSEEPMLRPMDMAVVCVNLSHHLFVTLDTPVSSDIIPISPCLHFVVKCVVS
jgi:hypothetical protein